MEQEYIITVFSENKVGLLSQITTVFTCRNVNIESLTTSESALAGIHKFTIVVRTGPDHNVRILEIDDDYIVVEKTGHKAETQALFRLLQPFGVQQFVRSGTVAIIKSRRELLNEYLEELERNRQRTDSF